MKNALMLLEERQQSDPRIELEPETLALAKRNAFPLVAQQGRKKDGMGLAVGAGGALILGVAVFAGLSGSREVQPQAKQPAAVALPQAKPAPARVVVPPEALTQVAPGAAPVAAPGGPPIVGEPAAGVNIAETAMLNRHGAPALVLDSSAPPAGAAASAPGVAGGDVFSLSSGSDVAKATRMKNAVGRTAR